METLKAQEQEIVLGINPDQLVLDGMKLQLQLGDENDETTTGGW